MVRTKEDNSPLLLYKKWLDSFGERPVYPAVWLRARKSVLFWQPINRFTYFTSNWWLMQDTITLVFLKGKPFLKMFLPEESKNYENRNNTHVWYKSYILEFNIHFKKLLKEYRTIQPKEPDQVPVWGVRTGWLQTCLQQHHEVLSAHFPRFFRVSVVMCSATLDCAARQQSDCVKYPAQPWRCESSKVKSLSEVEQYNIPDYSEITGIALNNDISIKSK